MTHGAGELVAFQCVGGEGGLQQLSDTGGIHPCCSEVPGWLHGPGQKRWPGSDPNQVLFSCVLVQWLA